MSIIQLKEANCKNCYKCIRNCPLKAIEFGNEQAKILEEDCVLCGTCTLVCPQNAKQINSDLPSVKREIKSGAKLYVSLAPSYVSAFPRVSFASMSAALKKLGFFHVEETAIGATEVSRAYAGLMAEHKMRNIITTCCPSVNMLVEKYYPDLLDCLAPVASPSTVHARMMRDTYGQDIKVVFVGPCISKKTEVKPEGPYDAVLMYDELKNWMVEEGIQPAGEDPAPEEMHSTVSRLYPAPGGILQTIPPEQRSDYKAVAIDGLERCMEVLDSLRDPQVSGYFLEMSSCPGSCVEGPSLRREKRTPLLLSKDLLLENAGKKTATPPPATERRPVDVSAQYDRTRVREKIPDEATIREILAKIGKVTPEQMLNCGACGYPSCRDKAIAVYQGKADLQMCLPYMREKAESMSNLIMDNTPNAIFLLDKELNILEYNPAAYDLFDMGDLDYVGLPIDMLINTEDSATIGDMRETNATDTLCRSKNGKLALIQSVVTISNGDVLVICKDVTEEEENLREMDALRQETLETTQKVIDKQMRVAQEIASLLGETTGESKAALVRLKKSIMQR